MIRKRILACLLSAALLAGMLPTAALAAVADAPCENHLEHTLDCDYEEGRDCGHTEHTSDCYTGKLICPEQNTTPGGENTPHQHVQACYELNCPHESGIHDETCGYAEAQPCGHVCALCAPKDSGISEEHALESTEERIVAPLTAPVAGPISGDGYSFEADTAVLTITSNEGTTNWKSDSNINVSDVQSVVLEIGVTEIGVEAFAGCTNLKTVNFSASTSLQTIGNHAFQGCTALELDGLPSSLTSIGYQAFQDCTSLALTTLPDKVATIGTSAFAQCDCLALTSLPDSLTTIGNLAFANCKKLALKSLPEKLTTINSNTFYGCTGLAMESLPDNLTIINSAAFQGCTSLALTALPSKLNDIGAGAFYGCTGLTSLTLPQTTAPKLGGNAFGNIPGLVIFVSHGATGYDGENWPAGKVVYGAALSSLEISSGTLTPSFFPGMDSYSAFVENSVESVTVTPTAHDAESITVNGTTVTSGSASGTISLTAGNATQIHVIAKNSDADSRTYTIDITRAASDAVSVTGVTLDQTVLTLYTNKSPNTAKLTATVQPDNATTKTVTWTSNAPGVAAVDGSGNVTAVAPGTATITVTTLDGRKTAACTVTVEEASIPVTGVTLNQTTLTLYTNKNPRSAKLTATVQPSDATNQAVTWTSSAAGVATVDGSGNVTAVAPGSATITATTADGGKTAACAVTVITESSSSGGGGSSGSSGSSYLHRILTDKVTGVAVEGDRIHEYATLNVKAGALHKAGDGGCDLLRTAQEEGRVLCTYDISLSRAFLGSVTVSIPVEDRDGQILTIAHCIDGKLALSNVKVKGGAAEVQVKDLSPFAVLNGVYTLDTLAAPAVKNPFTDVKESDWFYDAVMFAYQNGLMSGTGPNTFDPRGAVTRAQVPVVLYRMEGSPVVTAQSRFVDVRPGQWYVSGITWAAGAGLVDGYNATTYGPGDPVTREQLAVILYRYAQFKKWDATQRDGLTAYTDKGDISAWAQEAMEWAVGAGLLQGSNGTLSPKAGATRAEFAQMLQRLMKTYQPAAPVALAPGTSKLRRYRVQKGDTLWALARRYNCTVTELVAANAMIKNPGFILIGWTLNIP